MNPSQPIFFMPNRVWRCYTGGLLLDRFVSNPNPQDKHLPEDWVGSTVAALNGERSLGPNEGLARVRLPDGEAGLLFRDVLATAPKEFLGPDAESGELSILCKLLDSAVRLPIQCHPDIPFAKEHYGSDHGKTEAWVILDTRVIDGVEPYLLMGFKPGITAEAFAEAVHRQDTRKMESMLHRVPARVGDVWMIPGRFPHAIGSGVFLFEVQEPSDWVVQPEAKCADTCLSETDMWGPLTPEVGLQCFDYEGLSLDEVRARSLCLPVPLGEGVERLIGPEKTACFGVDRIIVQDSLSLRSSSPYRIEVVVAGRGEMVVDGVKTRVVRGQTYFVPYGVREVTYKAVGAPLVIYTFAPG